MIYQKENQSQSEGTKKLDLPNTIFSSILRQIIIGQGGWVGVSFLNKFTIQKFVLKVSNQFEKKMKLRIRSHC